MVNLVSGKICGDKYCGIFFCAAADGDGGRRVYVYICCCYGRRISCALFWRPCIGGIYNGDFASSYHRQPGHDESWDHRLLYIENI